MMFAIVASLFFATTAATQSPVDLPQVRASPEGNWEGNLEYLDYGANEWFGIPVKSILENQGDSATMIRRSNFNDGPIVGNVRITTVELYDAAKSTVSVGTFRKGREAEISI